MKYGADILVVTYKKGKNIGKRKVQKINILFLNKVFRAYLKL